MKNALENAQNIVQGPITGSKATGSSPDRDGSKAIGWCTDVHAVKTHTHIQIKINLKRGGYQQCLTLNDIK